MRIFVRKITYAVYLIISPAGTTGLVGSARAAATEAVAISLRQKPEPAPEGGTEVRIDTDCSQVHSAILSSTSRLNSSSPFSGTGCIELNALTWAASRFGLFITPGFFRRNAMAKAKQNTAVVDFLGVAKLEMVEESAGQWSVTDLHLTQGLESVLNALLGMQASPIQGDEPAVAPEGDTEAAINRVVDRLSPPEASEPQLKDPQIEEQPLLPGLEEQQSLSGATVTTEQAVKSTTVADLDDTVEVIGAGGVPNHAAKTAVVEDVTMDDIVINTGQPANASVSVTSVGEVDMDSVEEGPLDTAGFVDVSSPEADPIGQALSGTEADAGLAAVEEYISEVQVGQVDVNSGIIQTQTDPVAAAAAKIQVDQAAQAQAAQAQAAQAQAAQAQAAQAQAAQAQAAQAQAAQAQAAQAQAAQAQAAQAQAAAATATVALAPETPKAKEYWDRYELVKKSLPAHYQAPLEAATATVATWESEELARRYVAYNPSVAVETMLQTASTPAGKNLVRCYLAAKTAINAKSKYDKEVSATNG